MADQFDLIICNAAIYDGSGAAPFAGDVAIKDQKIAAVGAATGTGREIDARGLAVAPGFIDVHSHDDFIVFLEPAMDFKVMQGVTTDVVGNCGLGAAPYPAAAAIFGALHAGAKLPTWEGYRGYFEAIDLDPPSLNVSVLAGHGSIRLSAMGNAKRQPTTEELSAMRRVVREALEAGAVGLSTGLVYEPGRYAETEEIIDLSREMAETGGLYASHMRNEADRLLDSVRETIRIGAETGVPVQISHHKAGGQENWGRVRDSLELIEQAQSRGLDVTADQYPYLSGSTSLAAVMQNNALDEGGKGGFGSVKPEQILIASAPHHPDYEGKSLKQLAQAFGLDPAKAAMRVVEEEGAGAVAILEVMSEADVRTVMRHPSTMIGSDGLAMGSKPHPRLYGCFPRVLGHYARDLGLFRMEEAIHRMTGMPAAKFRLRDRGVIRAGAFADLVVFDPATIIDTATYDDPRRYPKGIAHVFVNGTAVVSNGTHTGARPGRALRRG
jgi:N-acyl-D-aspartate/D-glutamate deacylase